MTALSPTSPVLLVIDDEPLILRAFRAFFREPAFQLLTASTAAEGLEHFSRRRPDVVVLDLHLPDQPGMEVFRRIRELDAQTPVILITGNGTTETAIEAMKRGAYDYLIKPLTFPHVRDVVAGAVHVGRLARTPATMGLGLPAKSADPIIGRCPAMQEVYKAIGMVAGQDITVLIEGESGTGKELVARAIYQHSRRANGPFLAVNCAAIPEALLESELFGHEKGAFTGAERQRVGKFEQCSGGTLFLDEVGDMTPLTQAKVLRLIQEQRFERVGGTDTVQTDVRMIAASNRRLDELVAKGQFRGDLYYRLSVFGITLPPLRGRGEDLQLLVDHFITTFGLALGKQVRSVAPETMAVLRGHPWPGNVRELESVLKQALLRSQGPVLLPEFLPPSLAGPEKPSPANSARLHAWLDLFIAERLEAGSLALFEEARAEAERHLLTRLLEHTLGNQLQAARLLGIGRGKLRSRLRAHGICAVRPEDPMTDPGGSLGEGPDASG